MAWAVKLQRTLLVLLFPLAMLFGTPALAQQTGTIKGVTIDDGGLAVPGVLMTVESPNLIGGTQQRETDAQGRFLFTKLPPGVYMVRAEMAGFSTVEYPNIQVLLGRTVALTVDMKLLEAGMEIIVEDDSPPIDTETTQRATVMSEEFLDRVPTGRDYLSAVSAAPGVIGGGNPNMGGAAYNENTYMIDGVNITDPVTGTFSLNFNFDAIQQLEVVTGAFDAEHSTNLGGIINITTRSGGNQLEFESNIYYESANWSPKMDGRYAADGVQLSPTGFDSEFTTYSINGLVGGPIVRDKAWFIISYSGVRSLISNVGVELPRDYEGHYIYGKLTAQPVPAHRVTAIFQADPTTVDNMVQNSRFVRPEAQARQTQGGFVVGANWDWFLSPEVFVESKATYQRSYIEIASVPCTHSQELGYHPCNPDETEGTNDFETPGRVGINNAFDSENYGYFYLDDRERYRVETKGSLLQRNIPVLPGTHDFKAGVEADVLRQDQVQGYNGNLLYYDLNRVAYDPNSLENYYWVETTGSFQKIQRGEHYGAFVQDVYKPIDNLTFRLGLRYDRSIMRSNTDQAVVNVGVFGPRFYTAWDPWGDEKTKISGGYGRFNSIGNLGVASPLSNTGYGSKLFLGEPWGNYTNSNTSSNSLSPLENTNRIHDGLTAPHSDEFTLGAERAIIDDLVFAVGFTGKFTRNIYIYDETNVIWDQDGYAYVGTGNGQIESLFRLRTPDVSRRDYYQTDVQLRKRWADRWLLQSTYSYTVSRGTILNASAAGLAVPPQAEYSYGNLSTDIRHQVKTSAAWDLPNDPWTTTVGLQLQYYSGYPISRYYYGSGYGGNTLLRSDLGTYTRTEPVFYLDIQARQKFDVRKGNFAAVFTLSNAINAQQPEWVSGGWINSQNRWVVGARQRPVQAQVGLEYQF
jgi:hypothetical protein